MQSEEREVVPLKSFGCSICGAQAPKEYLKEGKFEQRMAWLRRHYSKKHPRKFKASVRKAVRTRKGRKGR